MSSMARRGLAEASPTRDLQLHLAIAILRENRYFTNFANEETIMEVDIRIEELEERIAPSVPNGLKGYEGHPGNQGNH